MNEARPTVAVRGFTPDDVADFRALAADPRVTRHVGDGTPWDDERAAVRAGAAVLDGHHWYSVVLDGRTWAGIVVLERTEDDAVELGVWIHPDHWGSGVATRSAAAALQLHLDREPNTTVIAHVAPDNAGSQNLMARLGFRQTARVRGRYGTAVDEFRLTPEV